MNVYYIIKIKTFASALLLVGVHATNGAIYFDNTASLTPFTLSASVANLEFLLSKSVSAAGAVAAENTSTYRISTDYNAKKHTMTL